MVQRQKEKLTAALWAPIIFPLHQYCRHSETGGYTQVHRDSTLYEIYVP